MTLAPLVFIGHAPSETGYLEELLVHFRPLEDHGSIRVFHEGCVPAGEDVATAIRANLDSAELVLLLVSPHLLASRSRLIRQAEDIHRQRQVVLIPVRVCAVSLHDTLLGELRSVPKSGGWASMESSRDAIWAELIVLIKEHVALLERPSTTTPTAAVLQAQAFLTAKRMNLPPVRLGGKQGGHLVRRYAVR